MRIIFLSLSLSASVYAVAAVNTPGNIAELIESTRAHSATNVGFEITGHLTAPIFHQDFVLSDMTGRIPVWNASGTSYRIGDIARVVGVYEVDSNGKPRFRANALSVVDSVRTKINGCSNIFYRAFLPLVKWRDRKERLVQPFELTIGDPDHLLFIDEDWTVEGSDPKLTPREISFADVAKHPRTDTCFIFTSANTTIGRIWASMQKLKGSNVRNWYVFAE